MKMTTGLTSLLIGSAMLAQPASANVWREIEIIVFQQLEGHEDLRESFSVDIKPINVSRSGDFITQLIQPDVKAVRDSMEVCFSDPKLKQPEHLYPLPEISLTLKEDDPLLIGELLIQPAAEIQSNYDYQTQSGSNDYISYQQDGVTSYSDGINTDFSQQQPVDPVENRISTSQINNSDPDPFAETETAEPITQLAELEILYNNPTTVACVFPQELAFFDDGANSPTQIIAQQVPSQLFAPGIGDSLSRVMPNTDAKLKEVARNIRRSRNMRVLLHTVWRQEIAYGRKGKNYRVFAGKNYSEEFHYSGLPNYLLENNQQIPGEQLAQDYDHDSFMVDLMSKIQQAGPHLLEQQEVQQQVVELPRERRGQPEQSWQLDGNLRFYLKNVGRTPYIFLDSDLNYRQPGEMPAKYQPLLEQFQQFQLEQQALALTDSAQLESTAGVQQQGAAIVDNGLVIQDNLTNQYLYAYNFNQTRRIISSDKEIHHFDHPYFGVILQVRRCYMNDCEE